MNLGQSIRTGAKWLMVGKVGRRLLQFTFGVILARLLVPADFGMIVTIQVFTGFVGMLAGGGMGQSLIRAKDVDEHDFNVVFTLQLALAVLVYLGFYISAPWFGSFFGDPLYADLIRVSAVVFLMRPLTNMRTSWLNRHMEFKNRAIVDVAVTLLSSVSSVLMAWSGMGVWSLTLSGILGAFFKNILLARITPLRLRPRLDFAVMRKHSGFGIKITANDFLSYLIRESKNLIVSKLAGPAFLGLFNKADSMSRIPNQLVVAATMEPVFRAMSKVQEDLDQTKYMFYRTITLFMVYTTPLYVGLYWVAEPFIGVVYGDKWLPAAAPMSILVLGGIFRTISLPCSVVLTAQNRLIQEMVAHALMLVVVSVACVIGINWGLEGVAWGIVVSQGFGAIYFYGLVYRTVPTRLKDLAQAVSPGLLLSGILFFALALVHVALGDLKTTMPFMYLVTMTLTGAFVYMSAFLLIPIPSISGEAERWRQKIKVGFSLISK